MCYSALGPADEDLYPLEDVTTIVHILHPGLDGGDVGTVADSEGCAKKRTIRHR